MGMKLICSDRDSEGEETPPVQPSLIRWSKSKSTFVLIPHSAGVLKNL